MNWAHIHLLLNHIPIIGTTIGMILLALAQLRKSSELKRASLWILIIMALVSIPVYLTGEPAEEIAEHLPGVSEAVIEEHEAAAEMAFVAMEVLGAVALLGFIFMQRSARYANLLITTSLILSIIVGGLMAWTSNLGGQIRHTEARRGFDAPTGDERENIDRLPGPTGDPPPQR